MFDEINKKMKVESESWDKIVKARENLNEFSDNYEYFALLTAIVNYLEQMRPKKTDIKKQMKDLSKSLGDLLKKTEI